MVTGVTTNNMTNTNMLHAVPPTNFKDPQAPAPTIKNDRRSNKPIMEKRRRARINNCLNELKALILDATKKEPARHVKLEKADILEKTVKHLQWLQRQQTAIQQASDPKVLNKFKSGFAECVNEVGRFQGIEPNVRRRLLHHLGNCMSSIKSANASAAAALAAEHQHQLQQQQQHQHPQQQQQQQQQPQHPHMPPHQQLLSPPSSPEGPHLQSKLLRHSQPPQPMPSAAAPTFPLPMPPHQITHQNVHQQGGAYFLPNGMQVFPTKMPNGSVAFVLPPHLHPQYQQQIRQQQQQQQQQQKMAAAAKLAAAAQLYMPQRTASTGSASSHSSSSHYGPPSPATTAEPMDYQPSPPPASLSSPPSPTPSTSAATLEPTSATNYSANAHAHAQPISLVMRKEQNEGGNVWRPW